MGRDEARITLQAAGAPQQKVIDVTLPSSVAFDLDKFIQVQKSILGRLGCGACTSGHDIRWNTVTRFGVGHDLDVTELGVEKL